MLDVERVATGGVCVARGPDGRVVFVRHALPGERVRVRVTEVRASYLRADAVEVLSPAPERVPEPCRYAGPGRCGGCDWQHVALPAQRRLKADVVREQLRLLAGLDVPVVVEEVPGAPAGLGWRTRVQFAVRADGRVGLRRARSDDVQPIDRCLIAHPLVEELGVERRRWPGAQAVEVAAGATSGDRVVTVTPRPGRRVWLPELRAPAVRRVGAAARRPAYVRERAGGRDWRVSGSGFWQVHPGAADVLTAAALDATGPRPGERVVDLYAGAGLFAGALAAAVGPTGDVLAVEGDPAAAADAAVNLADQPHVRVRAARVDAELVAGLPAPDLVVLDPPRSGAGRAVSAALTALRPGRVCYVACDPAALARDLATFAAGGYRLAALRAFDLFPMTAHVECVALVVPA